NYGYSSAMKGAEFVWDKEKLDHFIAKPDEVVPGNNMKPYGGLTSGRRPRQGDCILGVAHYQLSGYVALLIFEHCGELALLRNRGLGPLAVTVCPIALARTAAATACAGVQSTAPLFRRQRPARCSVHHR